MNTWLVHPNLFKTWTITRSPWARNIGWFSDLQQTAVDSDGWVQYGTELNCAEYVHIVSKEDATQTLYRYDGTTWDYIVSPVVFVFEKNADEKYIVGWAGPTHEIDALLATNSNPWTWEPKTLIPVDPVCAVPTIRRTIDPKKLPVFFVSNGEPNAEANWNRVLDLCPRAVHVSNITGRRNVFQHVANLAKASHFIKITAKNYVTDPDIFDFYPNSIMSDAHIVFHARNMSNGLEYGHMGIVCYNTQLVLDTPESFGLDFTQYSKTYTIPTVVSEATFATSAHEAWRTAFRETVKLTMTNTDISEQYLSAWHRSAHGQFSDWVLQGAIDGEIFANKYRHNSEKLEKTVEWNWLTTYFTDRGYNATTSL